jgi:Oxidoreductase family, C-terminal alpha/beta domain
VMFSYREASVGRAGGAGLEFFGTKGSLGISRGGFHVISDRRMPPGGAVPVYVGQPAIPPSGPQHLFQRPKPEPWIEPLEASGSELEQFDLHVRNFIDCIKSRARPNADVEFGHRATTACHLANISLRTGRKIRWDPEKEEIAGDREASAYLARPYRKPWDEELRSLGLGA